MTITDDGIVDFTKDELDQISKMVHYIALRYTGWSGTEYDDLKSELWIKVFDVVRATRKLEMNYVAMSCYNLAHDICRKAKRKVTRIDTNSDTVEEMLTDSIINSSDDSTYLDNIIIQEIVDLFPKNSRERNYLVYLTLYLGLPIEDHKQKHLTYNKVFGKFPLNYRRDLMLAKTLGFSNDTSTGYRNAKYAVRDKLKEVYSTSIYVKRFLK